MTKEMHSFRSRLDVRYVADIGETFYPGCILYYFYKIEKESGPTLLVKMMLELGENWFLFPYRVKYSLIDWQNISDIAQQIIEQ
ncbi:MAG: hypothetical protein ACOX6Q_03315 [Candidatus Dojkabacteria bacterium]|jgi:hypothetical protein